MLGALSIAGGYAALLYLAGWPGLLLAAAHIAIMTVALPKGRNR